MTGLPPDFLPTRRLLGIDFADLDAVAAAEWVAVRDPDAPFGYVVTPNADHFVRLDREPALATIYRSATLRLLDSRVVAAAAAALGLRPPAVAPGSDVTEILLRHHLQPGERITIIGLDAEAVRRLVCRLHLAPPAHHNPPMGFEHDPPTFAAAVTFVVTHPARLTVLAVGSPRQERLAAAIAATGKAKGLALCVGGSLGFLAGTERRAPALMRRIGCEWLFRLGADPRRLWRRYVIESPKVFWLLTRERLAKRDRNQKRCNPGRA